MIAMEEVGVLSISTIIVMMIAFQETVVIHIIAVHPNYRSKLKQDEQETCLGHLITPQWPIASVFIREQLHFIAI